MSKGIRFFRVFFTCGILSLIFTMSSLSAHAATAVSPASCERLRQFICSPSETFGDLSGLEVSAIFDCVNQPTAPIDLNDRIPFKEGDICKDGYTIKADTIEASLFSQKVVIDTLQDYTGVTRHTLSLGIRLFSLDPSRFYFPGGHYFDLGIRDLVYFTASQEIYKDWMSLIDLSSMLVDSDLDGYSPSLGDCDDDLASVNPRASEGSYADQLDNNCNGKVDEDLDPNDGDGDTFAESTGDCNDRDSATNPDAFDLLGDGQDTNCDGIDGSATWQNLGEIGLYAASLDAYRNIFEGFYTDFTQSKQVAADYSDMSFMTRASPVVQGFSLIQELSESLVDGCDFFDDPLTCSTFSNAIYTLRAIFGVDGENPDDSANYLNASYHGSTYREVMGAGVSGALSLADAIYTDLSASGNLSPETAETPEEPVECRDAPSGEAAPFKLSASIASLADSLKGLASDPYVPRENVIETWVRAIFCVQKNGTYICSPMEDTYFSRARSVLSDLVFNQDKNPNFHANDAIGNALSSGFFDAANLRDAVGRINSSLWKLIDAFDAAYSDDAAKETATTSVLGDFYDSECLWDDTKTMYQCFYDHFSYDVKADATLTVAEVTDMTDYMDRFVGSIIANCGGTLAPQLGDLCKVAWDYNKDKPGDAYTGYFSDRYLVDLRGMMVYPAVAKFFKAYAALGHAWFYGLSKDNQIKLFDVLVSGFPSVSTAPEVEDPNAPSTEDTINELLKDPNDKTFEQVEIALKSMYVSDASAPSGFAPSEDFSAALDGVRALIARLLAVQNGVSTYQSPTDLLVALVSRLGQSKRATTDLDLMLNRLSDLLTRCDSGVAKGLSMLDAAETFVNLYAPIVSPALDPGLDAEGEASPTPAHDAFKDVQLALGPILNTPASLYRTVVNIADPGWLYVLFRDKDEAGAQLGNPLTWVHFNFMQSGLLDYAKQALMLLVDVGAYPQSHWLGQPVSVFGAPPPEATQEETTSAIDQIRDAINHYWNGWIGGVLIPDDGHKRPDRVHQADEGGAR